METFFVEMLNKNGELSQNKIVSKCMKRFVKMSLPASRGRSSPGRSCPSPRHRWQTKQNNSQHTRQSFKSLTLIRHY